MNKTLVATLVLVLLSGCAGQVGQTQTENIHVPRPADPTRAWDIELNLGSASVSVGSRAEALVQGTIEYNVDSLKPYVTIGERSVKIGQDPQGVLPLNTRNDWRLQLGRGARINLAVNTGASSGEWELGGLSLQSLKWTQGAADATLSFSEPNPEPMESFTVNGGAASMTIRGLANANIDVGNITAGAGALTLVFDGQLTADADITIDGGVSAVTIYSGGNPIQLIAEGALKAVDNKGWTQSDKNYYSPEWSIASTPVIKLHARLGVATLQLIEGK